MLVGAALAVLLSGPLAAQTEATHPVGYASLNYVSGYSLLNTQFADNDLNDMNSITVTTLLAGTLWNLNPGTVVQRWNGTDYTSFIYGADGMWTDTNGLPAGNVVLQVGEGLVVYNPGPAKSLTTFGYIYGASVEDENGLVETTIPESPPGIYLRGPIFPLGPNSFQDIMGRAPVAGDAVLKLTASGISLLSRYTAAGWVDPQGRNLAPFLSEGESAFFDTTGGQFLNFRLPDAASIPEPGAMALTAMLILGWFGTVGRCRRALRAEF
ncbi:MAG: hypothetical protein JWM59_1676 [Verrucomicrobiales bacterium]|nr:hypothetical protein [Verrucomicrobiales bacterium]